MNYIKLILVFISLLIISKDQIAMADTLKEKLQEQANKPGASAEQKVIMLKAIDDLSKSDTGSKTPKLGDVLPDGEFINAEGSKTSLYEIIKGKKAIVTFYRGAWCPYCNIQLNELNSVLDKIKAEGAVLVAISPELADNQLSIKQKQDLKFSVLSDKDAKYQKELDLLFDVDGELKSVYQAFGIDLEKSNGGATGWQLPLAVSFVLDSNSKITYRFLEADYKKRAEPEVLISELKKIK